MNTTRKPASGLLLNLLAVLAATASLAQVERRTKAELQADREALPALQKSVTGEIAAHLGRIAKSSDARRVSNAVRVVRDACAAGVTDGGIAAGRAACPISTDRIALFGSAALGSGAR